MSSERDSPVTATFSGRTALAGRRERKRASSRDHTIEVALTLFAERGYEAVTVADICAAADIAPRTFFRYFPAKEDLLAEPSRQMAARLADLVATAPVGQDDAAVLRSAFRQLGADVVSDRTRMIGFMRAAAAASAVRASPLLRLSDRERQLAEQLTLRRGAPLPPHWRTRLVVARSLAGYRIWLDDIVRGDVRDPLQHLDDVLAAE